jgi:hypothetical protein
LVNLADNSAELDALDGGYTVFGQVLGEGMAVFDEIADLLRCVDVALISAFCGDFPNVPAVNTELALTDDTLVNIIRIGTDDDGDGAIDAMEDAAPVDGDGNDDGIQDSTQQHVASFQTESGGYLTIETLPSTPLASLDILGTTFAITNPATSSVLTDLEFSQGYFGFEITGVAPGGAASVQIGLPPGFVAGNYVNFGPTPDNPASHWYEFRFDGETGAEFNGNQVALHYVDGGRGDADNEVNGVIRASNGGPATLIGDGDGIADAIEDGAPNNGDGNGDGIPDSTQAHVASLPDKHGLYFTVESEPSTALRSLQFLNENFLALVLPAQADTESRLTGLNFAHGFLAFEVLNIPVNGSVDINIILPEGEVPVTYYKYGPTLDDPENHLYEFLYDGETGAEIDGNIVTLHFVDGKRGDGDLAANGVIVDPGAPALRAEIANTNGGGSGGCSVASESQRPLQAGDWLLLLVLLCLYSTMRFRESKY